MKLVMTMFQPKKIVLTKREGDEILVSPFTDRSTPDSEEDARTLVIHEGWYLHAFPAGTVVTVGEAIDAHLETERNQSALCQAS